MLARIKERHTWPIIKRDVVKHFDSSLNVSANKTPTGTLVIPCKASTAAFSMIVHFDHLTVCKIESGNAGLLSVYQVRRKETPCAHDEYDAQTTANIILNEVFVRHGTPARMQFDNATNFTAEIAQENDRPEQYLRFRFSQKARLGRALRGSFGFYNSTRHTTTGFSPYMLQHGAEKSIPLSFLDSKFAPREFESKEDFVDNTKIMKLFAGTHIRSN